MKRSVLVQALFVLAAALSLISCSNRQMVKRDLFGKMPDGRDVFLFTLRNEQGMEVVLTNYGATVISIHVPDREGRFADVALGYDGLRQYMKGQAYFGCVVGRYANRIAGGRFTLDSTEYQLAVNDPPNHLHGGRRGFGQVLWTAVERQFPEGPAVVMNYTSPDSEEVYPGTLEIQVVYTLTNDNRLKVTYDAITDKTTIVNLTNHTYFNLAGEASGSVRKQLLMIAADRYTPVDSARIPTGELRDVSGTPFDFRAPVAIGARIAANDEQLRLGRGYDHNFVLSRNAPGMVLAARAEDPASGRVLEVRTTEPGVQFYSGNSLNGKVAGKNGKKYPFRGGFCLETQHFPDSPNHPEFPSTVLRPDQKYHSETEYAFSVSPANAAVVEPSKNAPSRTPAKPQ